MAYLLTAVMSGGIAAILSLFAGDTFSQVFLNYVMYGHLGIVALALASVTARKWDSSTNT